MHVGEGSTGNGTVNVNGGTLTARNALYVGNSGTGTLTISDGGTVDAKGLLYLGNNANSTGALAINEGGSATVSGALYVGNNGTGTLNLNGGTLTAAADFNVANWTGSTGTFNGTSGTLSLTGSTKVFNVGNGTNSTGTVTKDGGDWSCYYLRLGNNSGATGTFTHNGGNLEVKTQFIAGLANGGTGEFTINDGEVSVNNYTYLGWNAGASGTLNLNGGTLVTKQVYKYNGSATAAILNFNGGTLKANVVDGNGIIRSGVTVNVDAGGGTIDSNNLGINVGAAIGGTGAMRFKGGNTILLNGANTYTGGTIIELGTKVRAGNTTAKDTIVGNLIIDCSTCFADADNIEVFEYSSGGLTKDNVTFINEGDGTEAKVSDDGKKILVDFKARPWATVSADTTWSALVAAAGGAPASDASVSVKMTGDYTLTIDTDVTVGQIAFSNDGVSRLVINNGATLTVNDITGISKITNKGTLVKTGDGTVAWPFNNASTGVTVVSNGILKVGSITDSGIAQAVRVKSGATFDVNGKALISSVTLEEDSTFANTGGSIGNNANQTRAIVLEGNATINAGANFGLCGNSPTLNLGSYTLSISGNGSFWLYGTTISGTGMVYANSWGLGVNNTIGEDCTISVGPNSKMAFNGSLSVKNFVNGAGAEPLNAGILTVTGELTPGSKMIPKLTLASGATVKATGTAQVVNTTFTATGAYTIDASEINKAQLDAATDERIPVLTVPTENKGGTWTVSNPPVNGARAKWVNNGDGTSTLYIAKSTGTMMIIY